MLWLFTAVGKPALVTVQLVFHRLSPCIEAAAQQVSSLVMRVGHSTDALVGVHRVLPVEVVRHVGRLPPAQETKRLVSVQPPVVVVLAVVSGLGAAPVAEDEAVAALPV